MIIPNLDPGPANFVTINTTYTVTQNDINRGYINNTATVEYTYSGDTFERQDEERVDAIIQPAVSILKDVDISEITEPGTLTYTITISNTGNIDLTGVVLTDDLPNNTTITLSNPSGDEGTLGVLDVGETWTYNITYSVSQAEIDAGLPLTNNATVGTDQTEPVYDDASTSVTPTASVQITKVVDLSNISQVETLTYSVQVTNTGTRSLTGVVVTDLLPSGSSVILTGPTGDSGTPGVLDVDETWTYTMTYTVSQAEIDAGADLVNEATVDSDQTDPLSDSAITTVTPMPSLEISKIVDNENISQPGVLTYTITVTNTGNQSLTGITIEDIMPDTSVGTLVGPSGDGGATGILDVGEAWTYTTAYTVSQAEIDDGTPLVNSVFIETDQTEQTSDDATTWITPSPALSVTKVVDPATISQPGVLNYIISVSNTGTIGLSGVIVSDPFAGGAVYSSGDTDNDNVLDLNEVWIYTADYDATQADIDLGADLVNVVSVTSTEVTTPVTAQAVTTINRTAALGVTKTVDQASISAPGTLRYIITVTNTGTVGLSGVTVSDAFAGGAVYSSGDTDNDNVLDLNEVWIYTADYDATQADIDLGADLVNVVSVTSTEVTTPVTAQAVTTILGTASLSVAKTVDPASISSPGTLSYIITVTNTGTVGLSGVTVSDPFVGGAVYSSGDTDNDNVLDLNEVWTYTADYNATQADIDLGEDLVNIVSVTSTDVTTPVTAQAVTTILRSAALTVDKRQTSTDPITAAGQIITYQIIVTNRGNVPITNVNTTEIYPGTGTGTLSPPVESISSNNILDVGETWTYTATYTVTQSEINTGNPLTNTIRVITEEIPGPTEDTAVTDVGGLASLTVVKTQTSTQQITSAGQTISYRIVITNTGTVTLTGGIATELFPGTGSFTFSDPVESIITDGILQVGETWTHTATYQVTQYDIDAGIPLINTISVYTNEVPGPTEDSVTTPVSTGPSLTIDKRAVQSSYAAVGDEIDYVIVVTNNGNVTLTDILVTDPRTGFTRVISTLGPGDSETFNTTYTITQGDLNAGLVQNIATATYTYASNDHTVQDQVTVPGSQGPDLTITKSASPSNYFYVGQPIQYTVTVMNTGNVTLTNVVVTDPLTNLNQTISSLLPGESRTFNPTYSIQQTDLNRGYLINTATARFTYAGVPYTRTASVTLPADIGPDISITKSVSESSYSSPGTTLHYTLVIRNTGNVTLTNILVTDPLTGLSRPIPSLAPGSSVTITENYNVTQNDVNTGRIVNTARAEVTYAGTLYSDEASVTVPATQNPRISITKTALEANYTTAGDIIHYTLVVNNSGNVTLTGVVVTDPNTLVTCTGAPYTLAPGASVTCTAVHTITSSDVSDRSFANTATATGYDPSGQPVSASSNTVVVSLNNLAPDIACPPPIITGTSATTCDIEITSGLSATYSDPNDNVESLTWVMTGATAGSSPSSGINNIGSYTFNLGTTTITYTVTDAFGLSASCSFTVTVEDRTPPVAVCLDIDVYLDLETGTVTIDYTDVDGGSYDNCSLASLSIDNNQFDCTNLGPNDVTLTAVDASGNSGTCVAVVTVHYPVAPDPSVTPADEAICNGQTTGLVLSSNIPSTTWTWTVDAPSEITGASGDNSSQLSSINQVLNNSDIGAHFVTYTITPTVYGQCLLNDITAVVWVNPTPLIQVNPAEQTICDGESSTITVINPNASVRGQWVYDLTVIADPDISGYASSGTFTSPTNLTETLTNAGIEKEKVTYKFIPRIIPEGGGNDCIGPEQVVSIWVHPRVRYEKVVSDYNGYNVSCYNKSDGYIRITPLSEDLAPFTYLWTGPGGYTETSQDAEGLIAGEYTLSITDVNNCTVTETFTLTQPAKLSMSLQPSISMDGNYNINCAGASTGSIAAASINNVGPVDYLWLDGGVGSNRTNLSAGNYKVIITDANNCQADSSLTLTDPEAIKLSFDVTDTYCPDSHDGVVKVNATGGVNGFDYTYIWSTNSTGEEIADLRPGNYSVIVTDLNLCSVKDSANVRYLWDLCLVIPDAFSPNGDLINDTWIIGGIEYYPNAIITIYNRWGQMIWESDPGYPHPWDGRSEGVNMPVDGYHYVLDLHNGYKLIIGDVTLVR